MKAFWRGVLSIFDIGGVWSRNEYLPPPPQDPRTDTEKLEDDWRRVLGEWKRRYK